MHFNPILVLFKLFWDRWPKQNRYYFNPILVLFKQYRFNWSIIFISWFQSYISLIQARCKLLLLQTGTTRFQSYISLIQAGWLAPFSYVRKQNFNPILVLFKHEVKVKLVNKDSLFQSYISLIQATPADLLPLRHSDFNPILVLFKQVDLRTARCFDF